jgi:predicted metal-dependent hydrolase
MSATLFLQGIEQFNQREFYACHDTLETIWLEAVEPNKTFYQGILQIAVGCYHLSHNNWKGAVILLGEGLKKLREYEPNYLGINVTSLTEQGYQLLTSVQKIPPESSAQFYQQLIEADPDTDLALPWIQGEVD